jgi:hypothetical protein
LADVIGLLDGLKVGGGALVGLVVAGLIAYPLGRAIGAREGHAQAQSEARDRALDLIRQRSRDNAEISTMDLGGLCRELGGRWVPDAGRCD